MRTPREPRGSGATPLAPGKATEGPRSRSADPPRSPTRSPTSLARLYSPSTAPRIPARRELSCLRWQEEGERPQKRPGGEVVVGAVSPPERCSWSERSPDAELPGRCPKFYPAPPGVEPGRGRDRAGTGLAPATAPATATAPAPAVPAPAAAGGPGPCPRVSVLSWGSQSLPPPFGSRSRDPDWPSPNLGISPPGASQPLPGSRLCGRSRQGRGNLPSTDRGEGTDRTPLPLRVPRHRGQSQSMGRERMG